MWNSLYQALKVLVWQMRTADPSTWVEVLPILRTEQDNALPEAFSVSDFYETEL